MISDHLTAYFMIHLTFSAINCSMQFVLFRYYLGVHVYIMYCWMYTHAHTINTFNILYLAFLYDIVYNYSKVHNLIDNIVMMQSCNIATCTDNYGPCNCANYCTRCCMYYMQNTLVPHHTEYVLVNKS